MKFRSIPLVLLTAICAGGIFASEQALAVDRSQSSVEVIVKASVDSFVGHLPDYESSITVGEDGAVKSARFACQFRDLATGKDSRDKAMHKWQDTERYPQVEFVMTNLVTTQDSTASAFGRLTLHGITREIQFPVSITRDGTRYAIDGTAAIDTREFGLPVIRMFAVLKVEPIVKVRFHLQGAPQSLSVAARQ